MGKKVKVKVKHGKAKIKLKSSDERLPLSAADIRVLLASAVASALGAGSEPAAVRRLAESRSIEPPRMLPEQASETSSGAPEI